MSTFPGMIASGVSEVRKESGWFIALGILTTLLGVAAILYDATASLVSTTVLGVIFIIAGIAQLAGVFQARGAGHVILYMLLGALELVAGYVLIKNPGPGALTLTLVLSVYFMIAGITRFLYALWLQFPYYGWAAFSGLVSLALGILLWNQWPSSGVWFIGIATGVNLIFFGVSLTAIGIKVKSAFNAPASA